MLGWLLHHWLLSGLGISGAGIGVAVLLGGGPALLFALKWVLGWLKHATFLQVLCVALFALVAAEFIGWQAEKQHSAKLGTQLAKAISTGEAYKRELYAISNKRNEQQVVTRDRIVEVTRTIKSADERAKVVETAPPPGECKTSQAVLGADL
jgi:hypothetical protein